MGFFSNEEFIRYKKCTQPVYQTPASIQQMLDIAGVHENGIFEIEPNNGAGKKRRKFDRVYSFSDLNYVDQDKQQKDGILFQLRKFLNSMDTDFKITIQCEPRDVTNFQKSLLQDENKSEYPELARYNNEMIKKSLEKGQENVRKQRYLTVSANCRSIEEAEGWFDTFEHTALQDLSSRLDELNQMTDSIRRELRAIQSSREDSETENVISEYLSIQSAFANAAVPIEMEGKFENRLDEIEENYPIEELIHQKESNSKKEKQLQKEIKNLQQASRRLSKLKKIQKR